MAAVNSRPVVASLYSHSSAAPSSSPSARSGAASGSSGSQPHRSHPFSSISLSPDKTHAVASGKDVLHVLRLNLDKDAGGSIVKNVNRLEEIKSVRISQYFQSPIQTASAAAGGQNPQYPHLRDALRLPGAAHSGSASLPAPASGGGGGITINVTDVAWSLPQSYVVDNGVGSLDKSGVAGVGTNRGSDNVGVGDSYEELLFSPDVNDSAQYDQHYPPFVKRIYMGGEDHSQPFSAIPALDDTSVVAAAGSNGVVVAWNARALVGDLTSPSSNNSGGGGPSGLFHSRKDNVRGSQVSSAPSVGQPEAAFLAHSRAVNRLAWHPTGNRPYLLLTASQDGSVKLWDRRATSSSSALSGGDSAIGSNNVPLAQSSFNLSSKSWFGFGSSPSVRNAQLPPSGMARTAIWHCVSTYQPKCEAVRDIKWNPYIDDVFAMVAGEWLCVYDIRINKPMIKESTHAGDATSVDWHPTRKYTIATGGGRDRSVKVWDVESGLNIHKDDSSVNNIIKNSGSFRSENSETLSTASHASSEGPFTSPSNDPGGRNTQHANQTTLGSHSSGSASPVKRAVSGNGLNLSRHHRKKLPIHVLNIGAPVTRIRWRPPEDACDTQSNHHDSMIAVATSSIYGANAGGNGSVGLWSCGRPFMPISICEGHQDGAVTDFAWDDCQTRTKHQNQNKFPPYHGNSEPGQVKGIPSSIASAELTSSLIRNLKYSKENFGDANIDSLGKPDEEGKREWQTILTVGRDGQCLLQDFAYGERPILDVPRATFALANLSPFQPGFGSLQIMAVHQNVNAPDLKEVKKSTSPDLSRSELVFSITDQGDAEDLSKASLPPIVDVAPELTHLSRFSELYMMTPSSQCATKADVCRYNATVAESLNRKAIRHMWKTLATILDGSGLDGLPANSSSHPNPMAHVLTPTLRKLLLQRSNAGDVQTCVVLCEVMDVIVPPAAAGGSAKSRIPNLNMISIREWYLTYIDLMQQMCLFTQAASLIRNCSDPVIGALNQQSTTIHESCPRCGKPLLGGTAIQDDAGASPRLSAQRVCRSCRSRVGMCYLCHEPVKGIFVWCPGCGHGGHLDHALEWFAMNEVCPTGCGH
ncbi:hypothetical protein ACHAXR_012881, partial [Thalassiosira sp. AJA248-18]